MKGRPVRHLAEYAGYLVLKGLIRSLPHATARALGRRVGRAIYPIFERHPKVALRNLELAFPDLGEEERRRIARRSFEILITGMVDTVSAARFGLEELCRRIDLEGWHHLQEAEERADGTGVFVLSAHLGLWEIVAFPAGVYGGPGHVVMRPPDNPWFARELERVRRRHGNRPIGKDGAVRRMLRAISAGERVGILLDQRSRPGEGIWVPFFGRPAYTSPVLAKLSLRTGAPAVPIYGFPRPGGRYRVVVRPAIEPAAVLAEGFEGDAAVAELTRRYLAEAEREIRRRPEQWLWLHDRWKRVPDAPPG